MLTRHHADAAAWGGLGALVFLVLHQGYLLAGGRFLGVAPVGAVAALVWALTAVAAYHVAELGRRRAGTE